MEKAIIFYVALQTHTYTTHVHRQVLFRLTRKKNADKIPVQQQYTAVNYGPWY